MMLPLQIIILKGVVDEARRPQHGGHDGRELVMDPSSFEVDVYS